MVHGVIGLRIVVRERWALEREVTEFWEDWRLPSQLSVAGGRKGGGGGGGHGRVWTLFIKYESVNVTIRTSITRIVYSGIGDASTIRRAVPSSLPPHSP
eukprot:scaffold15713_cov39-Tisochrysis_lutea.AAC.1